MASLNVGSLGEYIREQRRNAQYSLRQLADAAGVSNPYLSQIERGLRKPSAEILQQIAKALRISAESLYVQAGILDERDRDGLEVHHAILTDPTINERQKQVLLQIYDSFRKENGVVDGAAAPGGAGGVDPGTRDHQPREAADPVAEPDDAAAEPAEPAEPAGAPVARAAAKTAKKVVRRVAGRGVRASRATGDAADDAPGGAAEDASQATGDASRTPAEDAGGDAAPEAAPA
ncbi:helix-turn-helix domain-containing protein [Wenjunlia vitaminophila]|uniref:helix-turn-helix domain-containing protein n=1 Tax=Wenjunlia vitaminophila TaxID=76728 RepID=UPI00036EE438|nr:helix-turn-helix transcriptional regulator [Wenjunlia vitaminophila]